MDADQKLQRLPNPRKSANLISILTFGYTLPIFIKGFQRDLTEEDIPEQLKEHSSKKLGDALEQSWKKEVATSSHPSLWKAIARVFWLEFIILGLLLLFVEVVLKIVQSLALARLITYYTRTNDITESQSYLYAGIIVGCSFVNVLMGHNYMQLLQTFGMKLRISCCSLIYRKSLRLKKSVLGGCTIGEMVNLLSNDVNRCDRAVLHAHNLWVAPLETILIVYILNNLLGPVSTVGVLFMTLFVPLQMYMGKKNFTFRFQTATKTDDRVRLMNEIITGIQAIKMYTWEKPFAKLVELVRKLEIRHVQSAAYIKGTFASFTSFTTRSAISLTVITYVLLGNTPHAEYVFIVTSFYNILRQAITIHFPGALMELSELKVAITRLQQFLTYEEVDPVEYEYRTVGINCKIKKDSADAISTSPDISLTNIDVDTKIYLENLSAKWSSKSSGNTLSDITIAVQKKNLIAIIGPVGSGKSSLLHVILRELPISSGVLHTEGKISYASQDPWVFSGTIQQNILFGEPMKTDRYWEVIKVCALERDLYHLPHGDRTIVGSRGVTLSGGQRARVNLARAIYKQADIYLLDDPLSAVDTHVGKHLFAECILKFLKLKCVILVTHQLQYLQNVKSIYLIEDGNIATHGTYDDLKKSGIEFTKLLNASTSDEESEMVSKKSIFDTQFLVNIDGKNEEKETMSSGTVSSDVYVAYIKAGGSLWRLLRVVLVFILTYASSYGADYFIAYWVNMEQARSHDNMTTIYLPELSRNTCISIYLILILITIVSSLSATLNFFRFCMTSSRNLHDAMFSNIVRAPMHFFNRNNPGRILNRFSKDMGLIDDVLPSVAVDCIMIGMSVFAITIVVCFLNPWMIITTSVMLTLFCLIRIFYLSTSRSVKRLEGVTRSPVFAHMSASLEGLTTIRAFGAEAILENEFDNHQDLHSSVWYIFLISARAFGFWLDLICVSYIGAITFSFFLTKNEQYGGNVGLAITQAMALTGMFQWGMRQWSELENLMTSVERVAEYIKITPERQTWQFIPPSEWPQKGNVKFKSVSLQYAETNFCDLKQLNFNVNSNEKIGIVGRTGAGKTSLIQAIFQMTDTTGSILIDKIDISTIPLYKLRSTISVIPQEPVLFSGNLRKNLDPFDEHSDAELWSALEDVDLKNLIADLPYGLCFVMSEGGSNFSVGQRQLLCLARAIIRKNKILILDEATANVDPKTDILIQNTIRNKFSECTVLTIAHRIHTIIDSDRVMVMDNGELVEFDHPYTLLLNKNSLFYSMVEQTGNAMAKTLLGLAQTSYEEKKVHKA